MPDIWVETDPRLADVAGQLGKTRLAVALFDRQWALRWVSEDFKQTLGEHDESKLGYGRHVLECFSLDSWSRAVTLASRVASTMVSLPRIAHDTEGGIEGVLGMIQDELYEGGETLPAGSVQAFKEQIRAAGATTPEAMWASHLEWIQGDLPPITINQIVTRLNDDTGEHFGFAIIYDTYYPPSLLGLIVRGDPRMYERMARLYEPGPRAAAVLFADLEASSILSRRLSSASYFQLVRSVVTRIDQVVVGNEGIVGKHVGDGVTAFFLADDWGSASAAAAAAVRAARAIHHATADVARELEIVEETGCPMRIGIHWGPSLFMGQLVTGGRLEVTALGDEVNECARIEQSAASGQTLASKQLLEQIWPHDAATLDLDLAALRYRLLSEVAEADSKAIRDAGSIPVTSI